MRPYLQLLAVLALALLGAWAWPHLSADPGYLLLTFAGWSIEASLVGALLLLIALWAVVRLLVALLRGPFRLLRRRRRAQARERLATGQIALQRGEYRRAERLLKRAASDPVQRIAALLGVVEAARRRGDADALRRGVLKLAEADPFGAGALAEAEALIEAGDAPRAIELLERAAAEQAPSPAALVLRARALAAAGRAVDGLLLLPELKRRGGREGQPLQALEAELAAAALAQAVSASELEAVWDALPRAARAAPEVLEALARSAQRAGADGLAVSPIDKALERDWDERLAALWGGLDHTDLARAIKRAEGWLERHPESSGLLLSLGQLCRREQLWGKAEDFLHRALAGRSAEAWEALGALYLDRNDHARAQQALRNALLSGRGEAAQPVRALLSAPVEETIVEQRSSMGLPQLPAGRAGQVG